MRSAGRRATAGRASSGACSTACCPSPTWLPDKGGALAGADGGADQPTSMATIYNVTAVGHANSDATSAALYFNDGGGGRFYNSLFVGFGGAVALIEGHPEDAQRDAADRFVERHQRDDDYVGHEERGSRRGEATDCSLFANGLDDAKGLDPDLGDDPGVWGAHNRDRRHYGDSTGFSLLADGRNRTLSSLPLRRLTRTTETLRVGGNDYRPIAAIDPRLDTIEHPQLAFSRTPPADGFFARVTYQGAFFDDNWADGWALADALLFSPRFTEYPPCSGVATATTRVDSESIPRSLLTQGRTPTPDNPGFALIVDPRARAT